MTEKEKAVLALVDEHSTQSGSYYLLTSEVLTFAAAIRDAALEEAAKLCSQMAYSDLLKSEVGECAMAAMQIRALKGTE